MNAPAEILDDPLRVTAEGLLGLRRHLRPPFGGAWHPDQRPAGFPGRRKGAGLETVDVRVFVEGDDVRHLDRNVSARTGVPHVRRFREERGATLILIADFRRPMLWGTRRATRSVAAAEALALGGWRAVEAGGRVGLYAFGGGETRYVAPRARISGMAAVAGGLAAAHTDALGGGTDPALDAALEEAARLAPVGATLLLASALDAPGPDFARLAGALARYGRLRVALVRDAFETAPPSGGYAYAEDGGAPRWARVDGPPMADERMTLLDRLGIAVIPIDVAAGPAAAARAWDRFDGGPSGGSGR